MITTAQAIAKYGKPNETGKGYLVTIKLPYPMRLAWDVNHTVTKITCHMLIADKLIIVFNDLLTHYGYDELVRFGIDLYGGCFNFRTMRGGSEWSLHS